MTYSLLDVLQVTIVSMGVVFVCLTGIMLLMELTGKIIGQRKPTPPVKDLASGQETAIAPQPVGLALVEKDELAKVAVLTALAHAAQKESGKRFEVIQVVKR
ncbi:OadG family protein [Streptococcus plurextorum]|uniref:OadG family protein n=1 Tax=Streptococcus plurextorum TaxID=456876 RepID=UPI0003F884BF|nr:OadG family protein [Streptococcus plurextorum]